MIALGVRPLAIPVCLLLLSVQLMAGSDLGGHLLVRPLRLPPVAIDLPDVAGHELDDIGFGVEMGWLGAKNTLVSFPVASPRSPSVVDRVPRPGICLLSSGDTAPRGP